MLAPITASARKFLSRHRRQRQFEVFYELQVGHGVADLVVVQFDHAALRMRLEAGLGPIDEHLAVRTLIALQQVRSSSLVDLARMLGVSPGHLRRVTVAKLLEAGWIEKAAAHVRARSVPYRPLATGIVAVEVKRRDWQSAVSQARRYLRFANQTFVTLDAAVVPERAARDGAGDDDIGMAVVDSKAAQVRLLRTPPWRMPLSPAEFALCAERAWALALGGRRSGPLGHVFGVQRLATATPDPRLAGAGVGCSQLPNPVPSS